MLIRSIMDTMAMALIGIVAAEPETERPLIYFPREVEREFSNSSIPTTDTLSTPDTLDNATPGNIEASTLRTTSTTSSENLGSDSPSDLLGSMTTGSSSSQYGETTVTRVSPSVDQDTSGSRTIVVTSTFGKTSSSLTSKSDPNVQDGSTPPTSDTGIIIAPTGIVASSSSPKPQSNEQVTSFRKPTATGAKSVEPAAPLRDTHPPLNEPYYTALVPSKGGISGTVKGPAPITTSRHGTPDFAGTGVGSNVVSRSSTEAVISSPLNSVVSNPLPAPPSETAHTGITKSPATTPFAGTASEPANTIVKPDPVVTPTGGVPVSTSKTGSLELPKTSSVRSVPATKYKPDTTHQTGSSASIESSALGLVPIPSSMTPVSNPLESVISSILPGPSSVNSTAIATGLPTESTLPPPIAVLPTGSLPTVAPPTQSASLPSGESVPAETATTMSPNTSLVPSPSSVIPVDSTSGLATQSSADVSLKTTAVEVSKSTGGPVVIPMEPSSATATATGQNPEIPVVNSTTPETATAGLTYTNTASAPFEIPVVNSTAPVDMTSLPTGPVTLPPTTSSGGVESASPTYVGPESASKSSALSSSSQLSSVSTGVGFPSSSPSPVDSSTAMTTPSRAPPATTPVQTESKPTRPPALWTSTASTPPSQPTTATTLKPFPTGVPKYFTPKDSDLLPLRDTENITISFRNVVSPQYPNDNGAMFNFSQKAIALLPAALSLSFNSSITDQIRVFRVEVCHDQPEWGSAIALVSFPNGQGMVSKLQMDIGFPSSPVYNSGNSILDSVTSKIDSTFNVLSKYCSGGSTRGDAVPGDGGGTPSDTKPSTDSFGNPVGDDEPTRQSVRTASFIVVGAVSFGVMYGAAMFVLARRYKRKKQSHRRSNSVTNSQNSSEMRYTGGGSHALMGSALLSREYFNYGAGGRDSRGSGRSGMGNSGRTANISAPVAAENSLGWN